MLDIVSERERPVILLIDDDLVSREVTATLLTLDGYLVHTAESGEKALEILADESCRPGAILSDVQMPGLSGIALITELRTACKEASIYVISGSQPDEAIVKASDGLLMKPFDAAALTDFLERLSEHRKATYLTPDEPAISPAILAKLRQIMPEKAVREIYSIVVSDLGKRIDALGAAIARHDREEVRRIGHAIKGGCGMAGALQAARIGALLEAEPLGRDNHIDNSAALLADLRVAADALQRILNDELPA